MAITYKEQRKIITTILPMSWESTPLRAIEAASNGIQLLNSGFHCSSRRGNNALYADTALRQAIEQGWLRDQRDPIGNRLSEAQADNSGPLQRCISNTTLCSPNTSTPIVPMRSSKQSQNMLFGARTIKLCIDCKPWGYSVADIKLAISEAAKGGCKVEGHVQTPEGAQRAIDAGIYIIAHGNALTPEHHRQMAEKGIFRAGTDTPFTKYRGSEALSGKRSQSCAMPGKRRCR